MMLWAINAHPMMGHALDHLNFLKQVLHEVRFDAETNPPSEYKQALVNINISRQTAHRYQAL